MPVITSIKPQKKRQRFNIYLDGQFALALSAEALIKAGLRVDQEITEKEIKELREKDIQGKLYNQALRFLSYRPRSEKEMRDYLRKKGGKIKVVEGIITRLKKQSLIDDRRFVVWWIEQRSLFRPKGRQALRFELWKKGVKKEIIEELLLSREEEFRLARKAAGKKVKSLKNLDRFELRKKMVAFLARRGFSWEIIKKVLELIIEKR